WQLDDTHGGRKWIRIEIPFAHAACRDRDLVAAIRECDGLPIDERLRANRKPPGDQQDLHRRRGLITPIRCVVRTRSFSSAVATNHEIGTRRREIGGARVTGSSSTVQSENRRLISAGPMPRTALLAGLS